MLTSRFFLFLSLNSMTMMYLGMHLFEFTVFGINWASWKCRIMFFIKFGTFGAIKKNSLCLYSLLSSGTLSTCLLVCLMVSQSLKLCSLFFTDDFFFYYSDWISSIDLIHWFFCLLTQICCCTPLMNFYFLNIFRWGIYFYWRMLDLQYVHFLWKAKCFTYINIHILFNYGLL